MITNHQLKTVVPVSFSDIHLLEPWVNVFRALGGAKNHPIEFHPTPSVAGAAKEAANAIKNFCGSVDVIVTPKDFKGGWPVACNCHFGVVVRSLAVRGNQLPWVWNELDMLMMEPNWSDKLINEYILTGGRGAMGVIMPMVKTRDEGTPQEYVFIDKSDPYMVGVGIYDPDHHAMCDGITDNAFRQKEPFDKAYRFYVKRAWRSTSLISSASRTINYREENGEIVMDDISGKKEHQKRAGIVPRGTMLHHGCKDDSLAMVILGRMGRQYQTIDEMLMNLASEVPKTAPEMTPPPLRQLPNSVRVVPPQASSDAALAATFASMKAQHPESVPIPVGVQGGQNEPFEAPEGDQLAAGLEALAAQSEALTEASGDPGETPNLTLDDLKKSISEAGRPMKIEGFAKQLKTSEAHIKSLVKQPKSGVNIVGGVWLKMGT